MVPGYLWSQEGGYADARCCWKVSSRREWEANDSMTGIGEVVLLPLDVLKIKMQTNPDALRGRGFFKLITDEGIASLYRGWGWTMARNAPGSFALFGGSAATKEYLFKLSDYSQATWGQSESSTRVKAMADYQTLSHLSEVPSLPSLLPLLWTS